MATAHDHIDLSFDLDEVLAFNNLGHSITASDMSDTNAPIDSEQRATASNNLVSSLPMVATQGVCSVCMEDFQTEVLSAGKQVPCGHVFHADCISTWLSQCNSCPLCRSQCMISGED